MNCPECGKVMVKDHSDYLAYRWWCGCGYLGKRMANTPQLLDYEDHLRAEWESANKAHDCSTCRHWAVGDTPGKCQNIIMSMHRGVMELPFRVKNYGCASWEDGE